MKNSEWFVLVLGTLATWRVTELVSNELGPFWIFKKFRQWVKKEAPKKSHADDGIECSLCVSVSISAIVTAILCWQGQIALQFSWCHWLAFSSGAILLHELSGGIKRK